VTTSLKKRSKRVCEIAVNELVLQIARPGDRVWKSMTTGMSSGNRTERFRHAGRWGGETSENFMSTPTTSRRSATTNACKNAHAAKNGRGKSERAIAHSNGAPPSSINGNGKPGLFTIFAQKTAYLAGKPVAFILATTTILVWAVTGPLFGYSDTWQLVINTGTTIVTFLMVFLIQNSQNRDSLAFQVKLDELIIKLHGAGNEIAGAEDLCDEDLEKLHETYRKRAQHAQETLEKRRSPR
jgi:low affinity Fe/Cu permease